MDVTKARERAQQALAHVDTARAQLQTLAREFNGADVERFRHLLSLARRDLREVLNYTDRCENNL